MKFFIVENNQQAGPYSVEEMAMHGVTPSTPVWREGMADWTPAGNLPELASLFSTSRPQPQPSYQGCNTTPNSGQMQSVCPKTWLLESILVTIFCCLPFGIVGIIKASSVSSKFAIGDFAGAAKASADAKKWTIIGLVCGIVVNLLTYFFVLGSSLGALM